MYEIMHQAYALLSSNPSSILFNPSGPNAYKNHLLFLQNLKLIFIMKEIKLNIQGPGIPFIALKHKLVSSTTHALLICLYAVSALFLHISSTSPYNSGTIFILYLFYFFAKFQIQNNLIQSTSYASIIKRSPKIQRNSLSLFYLINLLFFL